MEAVDAQGEPLSVFGRGLPGPRLLDDATLWLSTPWHHRASPNAVTRTFPASASLVARTMADVMAQDPILDEVAMSPDTSSKEYRNFSRADRQALGISPLTLANDVNFNIRAKCKDGFPVAATIRLKGESSAEVSVLYGFGGEPDLSRDLLDKVQAALAAPAKDKDVAVARTAGTPTSSPR